MSSPIDIVERPADLRQWVRTAKARGERVALVPTMGALHAGHLALVETAAEHADRVVASIFVNPTQFGPDEDFERYPRRPREDAEALAGAGCDLVFLPSVETVYPAGEVTFVDMDGERGAPSQGMEGEFRPGHFRGVATVVAKLFNLVEPDVAVFGEKDAQQLAVVRRMVRDLHFDVDILAHPTVREEDGLAMSSRNAYLDDAQRTAAKRISESLRRAAERVASGERDADVVRRALRAELEAEPLFDVNYAEVVDAESFHPVERIAGEVVIPVAIDVGGTRLLDNVRVAPRGSVEAPLEVRAGASTTAAATVERERPARSEDRERSHVGSRPGAETEDRHPSAGPQPASDEHRATTDNRRFSTHSDNLDPTSGSHTS